MKKVLLVLSMLLLLLLGGCVATPYYDNIYGGTGYYGGAGYYGGVGYRRGSGGRILHGGFRNPYNNAIIQQQWFNPDGSSRDSGGGYQSPERNNRKFMMGR